MTRTGIGKGEDNSGTRMPPVMMRRFPKDNGAIGMTIKEEPENEITTTQVITSEMTTETEITMTGGHIINEMLTT